MRCHLKKSGKITRNSIVIISRKSKGGSRASLAIVESSRFMNEYEKASLRVQRFGLWFQAIGIIAAIISVIYLGIQVKQQIDATTLQTAAIEAQYNAMETSIYQDLMSKQLDLDKLLVEHPVIYSAIFGKQQVLMDELPPEALGAAYYYLDFFQLVYAQRTCLSSLQDDNGASWITWKNTIADTFKTSEVICEVLNRSKDMYSKEFVEAVFIENNWCADGHQKAW